MRLDIFLKKTMIIKQRSAAKDLCNKELIKVNGKSAKPAREIRIGDLIEIETIKGVLKYKVIEIPQGNIRKNEVQQYYENCNNDR
jgi:ribosomal 50S subunit-recycling heat shock protein